MELSLANATKTAKKISLRWNRRLQLLLFMVCDSVSIVSNKTFDQCEALVYQLIIFVVASVRVSIF